MSTLVKIRTGAKKIDLVFDPPFLTFPKQPETTTQISHGQARGRKEVGRLWYPRHGRFHIWGTESASAWKP